MPRRYRFIPEGWMVEITCRTLQSRMLLRPSASMRDLMIGAIGRAQRRHGMQIHAVAALSNHYHALVSPESADQMSRFMALVNGKIAKEAARLHDWPQKIWSRRYEPIVVTQEERAQVGRLAYLLSHGSKEGLVEDPREWPGMHCARSLIEGATMQGLWFDRTKEYEARRRGSLRSPFEFASVESVTFVPLPCWGHLSSVEYRRRVADLMEAVLCEAQARRAMAQQEPMGIASLEQLHPHHRPARTKRSPAPLVHAASLEAKRAFLNAYRLYVASRKP